MTKHLIDHLSDIPDPRSGNHLRHNLIDILNIALTATICAIDSFTDMEEFRYARKEWFESFLECRTGFPPIIPLHGSFLCIYFFYSVFFYTNFAQGILKTLDAIRKKVSERENRGFFVLKHSLYQITGTAETHVKIGHLLE
ncbi:transposase family protein [Sporolactobacillus sp. KGMB 08714]|uniref:transposase family protein n=1 Tax=Sporolactobacillus sp. KGMB 08714 TaxID=3064704 RepID=UPI002FBEB72A